MSTDEADALADLLAARGTAPTAAAVEGTASGVVRRREAMLIVAGLAVAALWVLVSTMGIMWALNSGVVPADASPAYVDAAANVIVFGGLVLITLAAVHLAPVSAPLDRISAGPALMLGFGIGLSGLLLAVAQAWVGGHVRAGASPASGGIGLLLLGTFVTLFQVAAEELFFRSWLQSRLTRLIGPAGAVAAAAAAFSLMHLSGGARGTVALINIFVAGMLFGLLFLKTSNILAPIAAHFAWNWSETILLGLSPNPGVPAYGAILDLDIVGRALWGGSGEGLNAAMPVTVALAALILPIAAYARERARL